MNHSDAEQARSGATADRLVRHGLADRLFHWVTAVSVLVLTGTAFLPILGVEFAWVAIHWMTGIVLTVAVLFHTVRALLWQDLRSMWIGLDDWRDCLALVRWTLRLSRTPPRKPGKYSLAQKLVHHFFTLTVLAAVVTGCLMLVKIDTPWWRRDPYWLAESTWGVVYVLHGLAALLLITVIITHVYFALRPEKLVFTRSMILGWITRKEYRDHHDPTRWQVDR